MATRTGKTSVKPIVPAIPAAPVAPAIPAVLAAAPQVEETAPAAVEAPAPLALPEPAAAAAPVQEDPVTPAASEPVQAAAEAFVTQAEPAAAAAAGNFFEGYSIMDTFDINKGQALFADWNDRTKAAVEKSTKLVEEANDFAKGNVEALVESGRIAAKGLEAMGQDAAEYGRKSFESATAALKTMSSVRSPADFFKLQSDFIRTAFDSYVAEASRNAEAMVKLAGDAAQPISSRVAVAVEKVKLAA
jgi:phasin family protein